MRSADLVPAVVLDAPGRVELVEVPWAARGGLVVVEPEVVGICGTDLGVVAGEVPVATPRVLGHELVGRLVGGDLPEGWQLGERVLVDPADACGSCPVCRRGLGHLCPRGGLMGREVDGALAGRVPVSPTRLHRVPDELDQASAAILQVLGTCVHAQRNVALSVGRVAAVVGLGVAGLLQAQLLAARGAGAVVAVGRSPGKRDLAARLGAVAVEPGEAEGVVAELTGGVGAEVVVEAAGSSEALATAVRLAAPGGTVVRFGTAGDGSPVPLYELYRRELTVTNPRAAGPMDYDDAVSLVVQGAVRAEGLVTHWLDPAQAAAALSEGLGADPGRLKAVVRW